MLGHFRLAPRVLAAVALLASLNPARAGAQQTLDSAASHVIYAVSGTVVDQQGNTLGGAEVALIDREVATRLVHSDDRGRFRFDSLARDTGTIRVKRLGFRSRTMGLAISGPRPASIFVALEPASTSLAAVEVDESAPEYGSDQLAEFYARVKTNKMGHYLDEEQLAALHPEYTSEALRAVPGIVVRPARRIGNTVRIRGCAPMIWVDGLRAPNAELDEVTHGADVAAIEVYSSIAGVPAQYTDRSATCGTILVWLKVR